jgi:hypothetical protein
MGARAKRFRVAFSFAGEKRDFIAKVAAILAEQFGEDQILYDKYHEAEFSRRDLGIYLPDLYHDEADLVVAVVCPDYDKKEWTGLEWIAIHDLLKKRKDSEVMLCRFERAESRGLFSSAGFMELDRKTPEQTAKKILERLALNEGRSKDYYIEVTPAATRVGRGRAKKGAIPAPPAFHAEPPYMGSHKFVGRKSELETIDDWADAADTHSVLLFEAIGGAGKSMLTWHWTKEHANKVRSDWAGQFWYSFYERGAIMEDFARRAVAYITAVPAESLKRHRMADLSEELLQHLKSKPYLIILDGLERVLVAYHRLDAAQIADEDADTATDQIAKRDPCSAIRPDDDQFVRALTTTAPSKVLVSTRLTPRILLNPAGQPVPHVRREPLRGLRPTDAEALLRSQGITGGSDEIQKYLKTNCDCHPLVTGVLAGLINDYLPARGNFDRWAADAGPLGGARLNLAELDLVQRKNHILRAAIAAVDSMGRQLLSTLALLSQAIDYETLNALNPHLPPMPEEVEEPPNPEEMEEWSELPAEERRAMRASYDVNAALRKQYEEAHKAWLTDETAPRRLMETVKDLERRGLLQYDHHSKRHDLHPVVRGIAGGDLKQDEKNQYGQRVVDYFSQKSHSPYDQAENIEDVAVGVQLVRTLVQMGRLREAASLYIGDLSNALTFNLEAHAETLSILQPFFPRGWNMLPDDLHKGSVSYLANDAGIALGELGSLEESLAAYAAVVHSALTRKKWNELRGTLSNISGILRYQNRAAAEYRCAELCLKIALAAGDNDEELFMARLFRFEQLTSIGRMDEAMRLWEILDPMGREWDRGVYRPGMAEKAFVTFLFRAGILDDPALTRAERLSSEGKDRVCIRNLHRLRGEWRTMRGEWVLAAESLSHAVRMAREVRQIDSWSESLLALTQFHLGQLPEPRHEAERLIASKNYANRPLAELWLGIGDHEQAVKCALAAYTSAWADGEPYVHRYELTASAELLTRLGEPIPALPPYDPAKDPPLEWEVKVEAAILRLEEEKA